MWSPSWLFPGGPRLAARSPRVRTRALRPTAGLPKRLPQGRQQEADSQRPSGLAPLQRLRGRGGERKKAGDEAQPGAGARREEPLRQVQLGSFSGRRRRGACAAGSSPRRARGQQVWVAAPGARRRGRAGPSALSAHLAARRPGGGGRGGGEEGGARGAQPRSRRAAAPREGTVEHRLAQSGRLKPAGALQPPLLRARDGRRPSRGGTGALQLPRHSEGRGKRRRRGWGRGEGRLGIAELVAVPPEVSEWRPPLPEVAGPGGCGELGLGPSEVSPRRPAPVQTPRPCAWPGREGRLQSPPGTLWPAGSPLKVREGVPWGRDAPRLRAHARDLSVTAAVDRHRTVARGPLKGGQGRRAGSEGERTAGGWEGGREGEHGGVACCWGGKRSGEARGGRRRAHRQALADAVRPGKRTPGGVSRQDLICGLPGLRGYKVGDWELVTRQHLGTGSRCCACADTVLSIF